MNKADGDHDYTKESGKNSSGAEYKASEHMQSAENLYRHLYKSMRDAFVSVDMQGHILEYNEAYLKMLGYEDHEILQLTYVDLTPEKWRALEERIVREQILPRGYSEVYEKEYRRKDGSVFPVELRTVLLRDEAGNPFRMWAIIRDITEQKRAREELLRTQAVLAQAEEMAHLGAWWIEFVDHENVDANPLRWSAEVYRIFGYEPGAVEVSNELFFKHVHPDDRQLVKDTVAQAMAEKHPYSVEHRIIRLDGKERVVVEHAEISFDEQGRPIRMVGAVQDITARKRVEEDIRRLNAELEQRVRSRTAELTTANQELESFAYSVSHDLRAPLRGIEGWSRALLEDHGALLDEQGRFYLHTIQSEAQHMTALIDALLTLSRVTRVGLKLERMDLSRLAQSIVDDLQQGQPERHVQFTIAPELFVQADPVLLRLALENLFRNAWKFTSNRDPARIELGWMLQNGGLVYYVRDNGVGFDMAGADRLFTPFSRLHRQEDYPGIGVGLATVQRIIRRHGGQVWAEGKVDQGATFYFTL
jgi:PAS domain S-box-containing protein